MLFAALLGFALSTHAEDLDETEEAPKYNRFEQTFINDNITISRWFDGMAEGIDLFLAGKKLTEKRNETSVTLGSSFFYTERDKYSDSTSFNINLRLPNVEEYWQLKFTSYDESEERGVQEKYLRQTARPRNYGASIGFFRKLGNVRTSFQPRINLSGNPSVSHSLSFESVSEVKNNYRLNPKLELYANASKGAGIFQALNFNYQMNKIYSLTLINEGDYEDRTHLYSVTNGLSLGQWITDKTSIGYGVFFNSSNKPSYMLEGYNFSVSWSQLLYRKILDYQIIPHLDFYNEFGFRGTTGITLNVNLNF